MKNRFATALAGAVATALVVSGCAPTEGDRLADEFRSGTGQGYISGDGAYTIVAPEDRQDPVSFEGVLDTGESFDTDDFAGQVYVVNFWYASCPPCRVEAPDLQALNEEFAAQGVPFLGINIRDQAAQSLAFAEEYGISFPSIIDIDSGAARVAFAGQVAPNAVPTTLVVDAQGRVAARISGLLSEPSTLRAMITDTLAESD